MNLYVFIKYIKSSVFAYNEKKNTNGLLEDLTIPGLEVLKQKERINP